MKEFSFTKRDSRTKEARKVGSLTLKQKNYLDTQKAELYFYGDIVSDTWQSYYYEENKCPQDICDFLEEINQFDNIDIYMNSGGGSVHAGLAIYHLLKRHTGLKTVYIDGIAASIASVIMLAGDKIIVPYDAQVMIHQPWSYVIGNADDFIKEAEILNVCQESIVNVYMQHVKEGVTREQIIDLMKKETWFTGASIINYFNVVVNQQATPLNCCMSLYYDNYLHSPKDILHRNRTLEEKEKLQLQLDLWNQ